MNRIVRGAMLALMASGAIATAHAQKYELTTLVEASETPASAVVLPLSSTSSLVVRPTCNGCTSKTYAPTARTQYFVNKTAVTLEELKTAVAARPDLMLIVSHRVKTGELVSVRADVPVARQPDRRAN